ncbi:glycosyltransferase family 4 protein [Blastochloris sulfoviridis]|uniref:Glycosyltransferase family 4 protein n=1 Tax=Blastochloris sulfoviridis TaxID=50712 RepID=A0A5M6HJC2_9HYPH|nr:glycosyltransferase family 4 protein [Blastochloris sulfoviridis]KAA5595964.1 glycosyltransferase family 4 protein [Blastochloris sulfoviridis]
MKILVIAHAHPDFSVGGAEIAAYNLFKALERRDDVEKATLLARTDHPSLGPGTISLRRPNEYLWRQDIGDWFRLRSAYQNTLYVSLRDFLREKKPDVVFVHHYANIGVEMLRELRTALPDAFIALTLHEYIAICLRNGQMVKNKTKRLCFRESIEECNICFPEYAATDFWLRKHYIQKHFEYVDAFVSPSEFLRQRYIDWGVPPEHISVIENGQPKFEFDEAEVPRASRNRFGFFGQITEYKGVEILLQAMHKMRPEIRKSMVLEIHGANLEFQGQWFQDLIEKLRTPLIAEGSLRWVGPYEPHELPRRMRKVDWVVVPSIWWENSPMVIQEAFCCRRPVITANIGGMAEKVKHGVDGLHFEARSPLDLSDIMTQALTNKGLWGQLQNGIRHPPTYADCAASYLSLTHI